LLRFVLTPWGESGRDVSVVGNGNGEDAATATEAKGVRPESRWLEVEPFFVTKARDPPGIARRWQHQRRAPEATLKSKVRRPGFSGRSYIEGGDQKQPTPARRGALRK
jgi:hypothetical protein